jgi:CRP-like cAMP-binding protein
MADPSAGQARDNAVLGVLSDDEYTSVVDGAEYIVMRARQSVYEANAPIEDVYFPVDAVFSAVASIDRRHRAEVCTVGREGVTGLPVVFDQPTSPHAVFCQIEGSALRLSADRFCEVIREAASLRAQLNRFTVATLVQLAQNVACNRGHRAEARAARWLLTTHDRVGRDTFPLTQEFLAQMLGVRRATISEIAGKFQSDGLIRYQRGVISITDRDALESVACECYGIVRKEFDALRARAGE